MPKKALYQIPITVGVVATSLEEAQQLAVTEAVTVPAFLSDAIEAKPACQHVPNMATLRLETDGSDRYLDINCVHCGISGCVAGPKQLKELAAETSW